MWAAIVQLAEKIFSVLHKIGKKFFQKFVQFAY